jgi:hypothetical protein
VRFLIAIDPGNFFAGLHCDRLRIEGEVFDLNPVSVRGNAVRIFHFARERRKREKTNTAQEYCNSDSENKRSHGFSRDVGFN